MQIQASKLFLSQTPIEVQQFSTLISAQQLKPTTDASTDNSNNSINAYKSYEVLEFPTPLISILFAYLATEDSKAVQFQMEIQLIVKGEKIVYRLVDQVKSSIYLYKLIQIDSCVCYEKPINCLVGIRSCQPEPIAINYQLSVQKISQLLSTRSLNLQNTKTVCTYRRQIIIKEPIQIYSRYESKGYFWVKIQNKCHKIAQKYVKKMMRQKEQNQQQQNTIKIHSAILKNWCVGGYNTDQQTTNPYTEQIKKYKSQSSFDSLFKNGVKIKSDQQVSFILSINQNLHKIQIPFEVQFSLERCPGYKFKMIKNLYIQ